MYAKIFTIQLKLLLNRIFKKWKNSEAYTEETEPVFWGEPAPYIVFMKNGKPKKFRFYPKNIRQKPCL